jgi:hypothetical protein
VRYSAMMRVALASNPGSLLRFQDRARWEVTFFSRRMQGSVSIEILGTVLRRSRHVPVPLLVFRGRSARTVPTQAKPGAGPVSESHLNLVILRFPVSWRWRTS